MPAQIRLIICLSVVYDFILCKLICYLDDYSNIIVSIICQTRKLVSYNAKMYDLG